MAANVRYSIGVIGAGTAGAAAALLLRRLGHDVTVYEAVDDPRPIGAGITLQPSGMAVLADLGLLAPILRRGTVLSGLDAVTHTGRTVVCINYRDLHPAAFGLGVHRGLLFETLFRALEPDAIRVVTGTTIDALERADFERRWVIGRDGSRHGPHDAVIVADGARSELRDDTRLTRNESVYPWGALWFIAGGVSEHYPQRISQVLRSTQQMIGFLPSGTGPVGETSHTSFFWSFEIRREAEWRARGLESFKAEVRTLTDRAEPILAQITSLDQVLLARYRDVVMYPWHADNIVYIGDAAHATSPQLGQGANLALVDAATLAQAFAQHADVPTALAAYSRMRHHSLRYYQFATRWLTPLFQSSLSPLAWMRDLFMGPACRIPYVRNRMLQTMSGLETGFFSRPQAFPPALLSHSPHSGQ